MSPERLYEGGAFKAGQLVTAVTVLAGAATTSRAEATGYRTADEAARAAMRDAKRSALVVGPICEIDRQESPRSTPSRATREERRDYKRDFSRPGSFDQQAGQDEAVIRIVENKASPDEYLPGRTLQKGLVTVGERPAGYETRQEQGNRPIEVQAYAFDILRNGPLSDRNVFEQVIYDPAWAQMFSALQTESETRDIEGTQTIYVTYGDVLTMIRGRITESENGPIIDGPVIFFRERQEGGPAIEVLQVPSGGALGLNYDNVRGFELVYLQGGVWQRVIGFDANGPVTEAIDGELGVPMYFTYEVMPGQVEMQPTPTPDQGPMSPPNQIVLAGYSEVDMEVGTVESLLPSLSFPELARVADADGFFEVRMSQEALREAGLESVTVTPELMTAAWELTMRDVYAAAGLPEGSEIQLQGFKGGSDNQHRISGVINEINSYVLTGNEFFKTRDNLETRSVEYTTSYFGTKAEALMYFEGDVLVVIIKGEYLSDPNYPNKKQVLLANYFVAPYMFVKEAAANAQGRLSQVPVDNRPIALVFGTNYDNLQIGYTEGSGKLSSLWRRMGSFVTKTSFWNNAAYVRASKYEMARSDPFQNFL